MECAGTVYTFREPRSGHGLIQIFEVTAGLALITYSIILRRRVMEHLFRCWREAEPREWAKVAHQLRRRFPFNFLVSAQLYQEQEDRWRWQKPQWFRDSPEARRWLRVGYCANALAVAGAILVMVWLATRR
jgi:hypothetical protein